jgi:hypothetical protein
MKFAFCCKISYFEYVRRKTANNKGYNMENHLTSSKIINLAATHQDHEHLHICAFCKEQYDDAVSIERIDSNERKLASIQAIFDLKSIESISNRQKNS